jgi:translation initiation factor 2 alpha subunit (eIF-2alpha)
MVFIYKNTKPAVNDIVIVKITEINKFTIVCTLNEYDNMEGYISYTELSKKRRYILQRIVHVGKEVLAEVIAFNNEKNYPELSIKSLRTDDINNFNSFHKSYLNLYNLWRFLFMKLNPSIQMNINDIDQSELHKFLTNTFWNILEKTNDLTFENESNEPNKSNESNKSNKPDELDELDDIDETIRKEQTGLEQDYSEANIKKLNWLYQGLLNPNINMKILNYINDHDKNKLGEILNDYSRTKIIPMKHSRTEEFYLMSLETNGLEDIKKICDFSEDKEYEKITENCSVSILYLTGGKYSLSVKQITPKENDIDDVLNYILDTIKTKSKSLNILNSSQ